MNWKSYWDKKIFGIELFKLDYRIKEFLYKTLRIKLPKLKSQEQYWKDRGTVYREEFFDSGYEEREIFFQNLIFKEFEKLEFDSIFEAGCGFGWNIKRAKLEFPEKRVGGVDFSHTQLENSKKYIGNLDIERRQGDICNMPLDDNYYDLGFSVGVFMNINPSLIEQAAKEMCRVCKKQIVHLEYNEKYTSEELLHKRAFKTNIVSHDYEKIYEDLGQKIVKVIPYTDFLEEYNDYQKEISKEYDRWEAFEGAEKYFLIIIDVSQ